MFSKASRFEAPKQKRRTKKKDAENSPANIMMGTPSRYMARMIRESESNLPSYMLETSASSAKKHANRNNDDGEDLLPTQEELTPLPEFGKDARGGSQMKRGKHGRFSMAGSYFTQPRGTHSDACGLSHDEKTGNSYGNSPGGYVPNMTKNRTERFGKDSYLKALFEEGPTNFYDRPADNKWQRWEPTTGTSAFKSRSGKDRSQWVKDLTYLRDKELAECEGPRQQGISKNSDFERNEEVVPSSMFKSSQARFAAPVEQEPGQSQLGLDPPERDEDAPVKSSVIYRRPKHSRFSEIGSMYNPRLDCKQQQPVPGLVDPSAAK
ncbi:Hypothetical Protein FCC1311_014162 [Hondaea fermentalgiana]|uniref:Uncharacterized protein n=1 Tax=Hondaea fermentalgiana TaxID=2315210 RepID=A0A2R5G4G3_9STRA|nr:Hypothetical Protein FCC1311_014162 [Hondaea fermentalgiana]|eukprot:GBG25199.1 Hypothetical Protein FCC1311_014162 [Hondaea fermentalgiana]